MVKNWIRGSGKIAGLCGFFLVILSFAAQSQAYNDIHASFFETLDLLPSYNSGSTTLPLLNIPVGGRQEAYGTAYTALSDDSTFIESNPAGSGMLEHTELAISHNNLLGEVSLESIIFGIRMGNFGIGAAGKFLHDAFTRYDSRGDQVASSLYSEGVVSVNFAYTFLSSFYFSGIALGVTGKLGYRSIPEELYYGVGGLGNRDQSVIAFMGDVGLLTRFNLLKGYAGRDKNFSIGVTLMNVGPPAGGDDALPTRFTAGIAYRPLRFLQFVGDFILPINLLAPEESEAWGFATGIGVEFTQFLALRFGLQLFGGNPRITAGTEIDLEDFTLLVNYTLDRTTQVGRIDRFSLQLSLNLGDQGRLTIRQRVDALYLEALTALADSSYLKVIQLSQEALELDPGFTPAKETLKTAEESYALELELERLREAN